MEGHEPETPPRTEVEAERPFELDAIRASLRASGVGVWAFEPAKNLVFWDEEMCRIAGCSAESRPRDYAAWREFVHPEDRARVEAMVGDSLTRGEYPDLEHRLVRPDGSVRHILAKGNVVLGPDGLAQRVNGVVIDLTERRQLEDRIREDMRLESLGRLAGGIAHDFNNMLTVILGSANLALDLGGATGEVAQSLEAIREAAERSATLTAQLLSFARRHAIRPVPTELSALVARAVPMLRQLVGPGVRVETQLAPGVFAAVDAAQLQQALMNVAANARDAMADKGVLRVVVARSGGGRRPLAQIEVSDNGDGIAPEVMPRVFEPFFSTKGPGGGAGLGLAIVHGIVRQHGGHVHLDSAAGAGTRITIELPAIEAASAVSEPTTPVRVSRSGLRATVLLVDDEPRVRAITATLLRRLGHEVLEAHDGVEALASAAERKPDLVVTDLAMPRLGGLELIRALRVDAPALPAVVLTGLGGAPDASVDPATVPDAVWVSKPYHPDHLAERVTQLLSESLATRDAG